MSTVQIVSKRLHRDVSTGSVLKHWPRARANDVVKGMLVTTHEMVYGVMSAVHEAVTWNVQHVVGFQARSRQL